MMVTFQDLRKIRSLILKDRYPCLCGHFESCPGCNGTIDSHINNVFDKLELTEVSSTGSDKFDPIKLYDILVSRTWHTIEMIVTRREFRFMIKGRIGNNFTLSDVFGRQQLPDYDFTHEALAAMILDKWEEILNRDGRSIYK